VSSFPRPTSCRSFVGGLLTPRARYMSFSVVTTRKADIQLGSRLTAFVTRESGAAELQISPSTWDDMEERGLLPAPYFVGPNHDLKRWLFAEVVEKLRNERDGVDHQHEREPYFRGLAHG
jgi:hypothetical protein